MTETALTAPAQTTNYLNMEVWKNMDTMAQTFIKSNSLPAGVQNTAQLMMIFQAGYELGMKPVESLRNLYIVNGRVALQGSAMLKKMYENGVRIKWISHTAEVCDAEFSRDGHEPQKFTYTMKQAAERKINCSYSRDKQAWVEKAPWKFFPENMLMWKVVSLAGKFYCADIIEGYDLAEDIIDAIATTEERPIDAPELGMPSKQQEPEDKGWQDVLDAIAKAKTDAALDKLAVNLKGLPNAGIQECIAAIAARKQTLAAPPKPAEEAESVDVMVAAQETFATQETARASTLDKIFNRPSK